MHIVKHGHVKIEEEDGSLNTKDVDQQGSLISIDATVSDTHTQVIPNPNMMPPDIHAHDYCRCCQTTYLSN